MRFALMTEPQQGISYLRPAGDRPPAEADGFEAFFRPTTTRASRARRASRRRTPGPSSPALPARPTASGSARCVAGHVPPSRVFAKVVTTVDEMSGGRIEVGVGAGWNEDEHRQLGCTFPADRRALRPARGRSSRSSTASGASPTAGRIEGRRVSVDGAQFYPKPVQVAGRPTTPIGRSRPRILIGGDGTPRSVRFAARYADEYNIVSASRRGDARSRRRSTRRARAIGRDPREMTRSAMVGVAHRARPRTRSRDASAALLAAFGEGRRGGRGVAGGAPHALDLRDA